MTYPFWYPLWLRRIVCRLQGHREAVGAIYQPGRARVGKGCVRCGQGEVREYRCQYPMPRQSR